MEKEQRKEEKILLNIKIGSVNVGCGGMSGCLVYLPELIKEYDIIGIQEANIITPKEDNEAIKIDGFNTFTAKRKEGNEQHRVITLVREELKTKKYFRLGNSIPYVHFSVVINVSSSCLSI